MVFRKIIGFGASSFVVSLPKSWVQKNGLKKGDSVSLEEEGNFIKFTPGTLKQTNTNTEWKIHFEGNVKKLKSEILYAYINNYNTIIVLGKNMHTYLSEINSILKDFMYLDIVDQTSKDKIILNTSINLYDISIYDTIRRMDRIVLSMSEDVKTYLMGKEKNIDELLNNKEENINKLCNFVFKTLKGGFNPNDRAILNLDINDIFYYWELALFVEKVGDQVKRIPRYLKPVVSPELIVAYDEILKQYSIAMKANFTKDYELALNMLTKKEQIYSLADKCFADLPLSSIPGIEKIKNINNFAGNIAKVLLKLRAQEVKI